MLTTATCCSRPMREITINTPDGLLVLHACGVCEQRQWRREGTEISRADALRLVARVKSRPGGRRAA